MAGELFLRFKQISEQYLGSEYNPLVRRGEGFLDGICEVVRRKQKKEREWQNHHFGQYAPEKIPYAITRYVNETNRLYGVMDRRLARVPFLGGADYSIADMASYPWVVPWLRQQQALEEFPNLKRWFDDIAARPATIRAYEKGKDLSARSSVTEEGKKILFGQTARSVVR
ncbi:hypothetical protein JCM25156A_08870 [Komagataeibacter kakiaceti JCM 25156]